MNYKELVVFTEETLGKINYPIFGNLNKRYTQKFLIECIKKFPDQRKNDTPTAKMAYLGGICRNGATNSDYKNKNEFNLKDFDL